MKDGVFFRPFVGASYAGGGLFGKRIMVLGESHYCDEGCADCGSCLRHRECMEFTSGVVEQYLDRGVERQRWMQTLLKFERSLVGCETDQAQSQRIWQSVVFYNYLQVAMGGPREAGTAAQYRQAGEALFDVMERWTDGEDIVVDGCRTATGAYSLASGRTVRAMAVNHPSVGYSWDYWHRVIANFLK